MVCRARSPLSTSQRLARIVRCMGKQSDSTVRGGSISREGDASERLFQRIVSHATVPSEGAAYGDVRMVVGNSVHYIEIKKCGSKKGGTLNQVRAIKYIPLVVHLPNQTPHWMVIPPNVLVERMAKRPRGQHTEIALESAAISVNASLDPYRCDESELEARVVAAIKEGQANVELSRVMKELKRDIRRLVRHTAFDVEAISNGSFQSPDLE